VKIAFSKALNKAGVPGANDGAIWERHYQDYRVLDDAEYAALVDYVHTNPMRHGCCSHPAEWPWSSLHRFVSAGFAAPAAPLPRPPSARTAVQPGLPGQAPGT
jgi:putative transposase